MITKPTLLKYVEKACVLTRIAASSAAVQCDGSTALNCLLLLKNLSVHLHTCRLFSNDIVVDNFLKFWVELNPNGEGARPISNSESEFSPESSVLWER